VAERREKKDISTSRTIAVRMPIQLLHRLNAVAADAATGRSHLLRQMIADYLNSMENSGIRFNGCLLSVDKVEPTKH
jgi:predicted DNA-binding protein